MRGTISSGEGPRQPAMLRAVAKGRLGDTIKTRSGFVLHLIVVPTVGELLFDWSA